jgi:hypothetical protein
MLYQAPIRYEAVGKQRQRSVLPAVSPRTLSSALRETQSRHFGWYCTAVRKAFPTGNFLESTGHRYLCVQAFDRSACDPYHVENSQNSPATVHKRKCRDPRTSGKRDCLGRNSAASYYAIHCMWMCAVDREFVERTGLYHGVGIHDIKLRAAIAAAHPLRTPLPAFQNPGFRRADHGQSGKLMAYFDRRIYLSCSHHRSFQRGG